MIKDFLKQGALLGIIFIMTLMLPIFHIIRRISKTLEFSGDLTKIWVKRNSNGTKEVYRVKAGGLTYRVDRKSNPLDDRFKDLNIYARRTRGNKKVEFETLGDMFIKIPVKIIVK